MARSPSLAPFDHAVLDLATRYLAGYQPALGAGSVEQGEDAYLAALAAEASHHLEAHPVSPRARALLGVIAAGS